ncbi:MAG: putative inorganic carbon transporter subunit DabA [Caldilineaceae bacterium]
MTPKVDAHEVNGRMSGMTLAQRIDVAAGALTAMSLTDDFARLVLLVGHGSTTVNNPYASGLDCGACGGHTGEANTRVAAAVLNDPAITPVFGNGGSRSPQTHASWPANTTPPPIR